MQQVERYLGDLGKKCNSSLLGRTEMNLGLFEGQLRLRGTCYADDWNTAFRVPVSLYVFVVDRERYAFASQLAVFRACPEIMSRLLKKGGSVLTVAKILVISRLLHKKLSKDQRSIAYVESTRIRLARLRQRLLAGIDKRLKALDNDFTPFLDAMCAHSLATSSSVTDVLRHYHRIRSEAILAKMGERHDDGHNVLQALRLLVQTITITEAFIPRQLSSALLKLKATPLFSNDDIHAIDEMDHDLHDTWIGEDIINFTPYVRHDDLQASKAAEQLATWASSTLSNFQESISSLLESMDDFTAIIQLRKRTLNLWFSYHNRIKGIDRSGVLDGLRNAFVTRLLYLVREKCSGLSEVTVRTRTILQGWQPSFSDKKSSLWDNSLLSTDLSGEVHLFLDRLERTVYGRTDQIRIILQEYQRWLDGIEGTQKTIEELRGTKWEEDFDNLDDDDELFEQRQKLLSEVDPQKLRSDMLVDLSQAFTNLQSDVDGLVVELGNGEDRPLKAVFLLRLLREFKRRLNPEIHLDSPFANSIRDLQGIVAATVVEISVEYCRPRLRKAITRAQVPQRSLWEGNPELPTSPSPWAFKLLQVLTANMAGMGSDMWTKHATALLEDLFRTALVEEISSLSSIVTKDVGDQDRGTEVDGQDDATTDSKEQVTKGDAHLHPASEHSPNAKTDFKIQQAFDLSYLDNAAQSPLKSELENRLTDFRQMRQAEIGLPKAMIQRLESGAADYWKRTALLFGFLA